MENDNAARQSPLLRVVVYAAAFAACSAAYVGIASVAHGAADADHAQPTLGMERIRIETATGRHLYVVEVAATEDQQRIGLMHRTEVKPDGGMLFPFPKPDAHSFWMKNTLVPLDIVFIGADHRVRNVAPGATPLSETPISSDGPVLAVLELKAGQAQAIGLAKGDAVEPDR